jgi:hypothetical protein
VLPYFAKTWLAHRFEQVAAHRSVVIHGRATPHQNGVVGLYYKPSDAADPTTGG